MSTRRARSGPSGAGREGYDADAAHWKASKVAPARNDAEAAGSGRVARAHAHWPGKGRNQGRGGARPPALRPKTE